MTRDDPSSDATRTSSGPRRWVLAIASCTFLLGALSVESALRARGQVFASLLLDPFGSYSALHLPSWSERPPPVAFPDRLARINGERLDRLDPLYPTRTVVTRLAALRARGERHVTLEFRHGGRRTPVSAALRSIGADELTWFWGLYLLVAVFISWSGMTVLTISSQRAPARSYAFWATSVFVFLSTFFDYHSTLRLVPLFSASSVLVGTGFLLLALTFPHPPRWSRHRMRAVLLGISLPSAALALAVVALPRFDGGGLTARLVTGLYSPLCAMVLVVVVLLRYLRSSPAVRQHLRATVLGLFALPIFVGSGFLIAALFGYTGVHVILPLVVPLLPLSIGYALIRHNILGTTEVLTRRLLVVPNVVVAGMLSIMLWLGLRSASPYTSMDLTMPTFLSGGLFVALVVFGHRVMGRRLFPATAHFRPTVQQIADRFATLDHHDELPTALSDAIRLWLPTDSVRLLSPDEALALDRLPDDAAARLRRGKEVWTTEDPWQRQLLVPMRSLGELRGVLLLAPKHQGALYTSEDLALLDTIASMGAVAMHNAAIMSELDARRRLEVHVGREDKRATLGTLSAQLAHEISHPLALFRGMLRRAARGELSERDVEVGGDEIERLERLLAAMRRLELPAQRQEPVRLREPVDRVLLLLDELVRERGVTVSCEVPRELVVLGDRDAIVQILSNLLRNGVQAAPRGGRVGVAVTTSPTVAIDVWDDGPGVPEHIVPKLFMRWVTNKEGGTGLGLAVTEDLVRKLLWRISYLREDGRSIFRLQPRTSERPTAPPGEAPAPAGHR